MRTHRYSNAKNGDVIAVQGRHGTIGYVIVTDATAQGRPSEGGHVCREATQEEVQQAVKEKRLLHEG